MTAWSAPALLLFSFVVLGAVASMLLPHFKPKAERERRAADDPTYPPARPFSHVRPVQIPVDWQVEGWLSD